MNPTVMAVIIVVGMIIIMVVVMILNVIILVLFCAGGEPLLCHPVSHGTRRLREPEALSLRSSGGFWTLQGEPATKK